MFQYFKSGSCPMQQDVTKYRPVVTAPPPYTSTEGGAEEGEEEEGGEVREVIDFSDEEAKHAYIMKVLDQVKIVWERENVGFVYRNIYKLLCKTTWKKLKQSFPLTHVSISLLKYVSSTEPYIAYTMIGVFLISAHLIY